MSFSQVVQQGDATELGLPDESAALVFTSPPYNTNIVNKDELAIYTADLLPWNEYEEIAYAAAEEMHRILVDHGRVFINIQPTVPFDPSDKNDRRRMDLAGIWDDALVDAGFRYRDTIAWIQDSHDGACAWGSWARPSAPNFRGGWESIIVYYKDAEGGPGGSPDGWKRETPEQWKGWTDERFGPGGDLTDCYRNVWKIQPARSKYKATFPIELPYRAIRLSTWPDDLVVDPFVGTGTTGIAAKHLLRPFYGVDKSESMAELATTNIEEAEPYAAPE